MQIDRERLRSDIEENAAFGAIDAEEGIGRTVLTGGEADRRARTRLLDRMDAAGLETRSDPVGNVAGRWVPEGADPTVVADATEAGLLFAPSRDGVSHNPREWTDWEDCAVAAAVLAEAVATVAAGG